MPAHLKNLVWILFAGLFIICCKKEKVEIKPGPTPGPVEIIETIPAILKPFTVTINNTILGYYSAVPASYDTNSKFYPLLVSVHGAGQYGNGALDLPLLLNDGVPQLLDEKKFPPNFKVNGENFSFIVMAPQLQFTRDPETEVIKSFIEYAVKHYRIDTTRIYLTGLSLGGTIASDLAAKYPSLLAAIVPMAGVSLADSAMYNKCGTIAHSNIPVWIFHNSNDPISASSQAQNYFSTINKFNPKIPPRLTLFDQSKHDAWTRALDPAYKENNRNIYEWMLQFSKQ